jgi:hypothetical protein
MQRPDRLYVPDKDPEYTYRWMNSQAGPQGDQNMYMAQFEGWEPAPMDPTKLPPGVLAVNSQENSQSGGGLVHRRGDLVLYRMKREQFEKTVAKEVEDSRVRMESTIDTMVLQAKENASKALRDRGQKRIPSDIVFREDVGNPTD